MLGRHYTTNAYVWNIADTSNKDEIQDFLARELPGSDPLVMPLIPDPESGTKVTTVSLTFRSKGAGRKAVHALRERQTSIVDFAGSRYKLGISCSCLGLMTLSRADEDPTFDICFVHGFGGHPLKTFSSKTKNHKKSKIWPRDLLPDILNTQTHRGHFMTFGYDAAVLPGDIIPQTLNDIAGNLLEELITKRGPVSQLAGFEIEPSVKPKYRIAALMTLRNPSNLQPLTRFQETFNSPSGNVIRGIVFFGTPFRGSRLANFGALLAKLFFVQRFVNTTTLNYLSIRNKDVDKLVAEFEQRTRELQFPMRTFYEQKKMRFGPMKWVIVEQDSAKGIFGDRVPNKPLRSDHSSMVKFRSAEDRIFRFVVAPDIKALVHGALNRRGQLEAIQDMACRSRILKATELSTPAYIQTESTISGHTTDKNTKAQRIPAEDELFFISNASFGLHALVENYFDELIRHSKNRHSALSTAAAGTCGWILTHKMYQQWINAEGNAVLFIQGSPGWGKSTLARFIIKELRNIKGEEHRQSIEGPQTSVDDCTKKPTLQTTPVVLYSLIQKVRGTKTPEFILKDIMSQLAAIDAHTVRDTLFSLFQSFGKEVDLQFLWKLFNAVRKQSKQDIFCIVDGLDECIADVKTPRETTVNSQMVSFLERICKIADEEQTANSRTKILFTTQPRAEISHAAQGRDVLMTIQGSDLEADIVKMVEKRVEELAKGRNFPRENQEFLAAGVIKKCSPIFQMAHQLLEQLGRSDLDNERQISQVISEFHSGSLEKTYEGFLEKIRLKYHGRAGRLIRILSFAQEPLLVEELQHALAVEMDDPSIEDFRQRASKGNLDFFMRGDCGSLIRKEADDTIVLDHPSVYEFFRNLSSTRWPTFSCENERECHLHLALVCIKYLMLWRHPTPTQEELDETGLDELGTLVIKSPFVHYAAQYWTVHVREAGELILQHLGLVTAFLRTESEEAPDYHYMLFIRYLRAHFDDDALPPFRGMPPDNFLASHDLAYLLRIYHQPREAKANLLQKLFRRKKNKSSTANRELKVNMVDWRQCTALHYACQNDCMDSVKYLLECGAVGNVFDDEDESPFSLAVNNGNNQIAKLLLAQNQAVERIDIPKRVTCLHMACWNGMEEIVECLLMNGISPNGRARDDWTPVHIAASTGNARILELLLARGGNPEAVKGSGLTPLYLAADKGHLSVVQMLFRFKEGLDPAPQTDYLQTPLYAAARGGYLDVFDELYGREANVLPDGDGYLPIHIASERGHLSLVQRLKDSPTLHSQTMLGRQAIHLAAVTGHLDVVRFLVAELDFEPDLGCDDLSIEEGEPLAKTITPIYLAATNGHENVVNFLLTQSVNISLTDSKGRTLLHSAAQTGCADLVKTLTSMGLDPLARMSDALTPFHLAAASGQRPIIEMYIRGDFGPAVADRFHIDEPDNNNNTALILALLGGQAEAAVTLLRHGADPSLSNKYGQSAAISAASLRDPLPMQLIIEKDVDINCATIVGETPLHAAAIMGRTEVAQLLLDKNANVNAVSGSGETPIIEAARHFRKDVFDLLLKRGGDPINHRDNLGNNAMDYVRDYLPFSELLQDWRGRYVPLDALERERLVHQNIRQILEKYPCAREDIKYSLTSALGQCFLRLGDEEAARICLEQGVFRDRTGVPLATGWCCDICERRDVPGALRLCMVCPDSSVCYNCNERSSDARPKGCSTEHKQLVIGGEPWKKLKGKEVNQKGQTFEEWVEERKKQFSEPGGRHLDISPPQPQTIAGEPTSIPDIESSFRNEKPPSPVADSFTDPKVPQAINRASTGFTPHPRAPMVRSFTWEGKITS
ncbi:hypothetical protein GP486_000654 [Trichoglossum hirsutum]|uniref:Nephrocystin 3-like N-terminal domain-containing protein n=1 Tax=Trichoglossum hirsutum TaxID=265104 RepID=A0A9P8RTC3_9PEZI|nr:hypothetical protein GP486_000654 [Trichoglossum hirsutum]